MQKFKRNVKIATGKGKEMYLIEQRIEICKLVYKLIKSICRENQENEFYAYNIIYQFQFHAKYLEEAVDCFISIISKNETILSKIGDGIKEDDQKAITALQEASTAPRKSMGIFNIKIVLDQRQELKYTNFVIFFLRLIYASQGTERNKNYIRFLKTICTCDSKGMTINQELLYKLFDQIKDLDKATFIDTDM